MKLVSLVTLLVLSFSINAEEVDQRNNINQQQFSRRPYVQVPAAKADKFEGDVVDAQAIEVEKKQRTIQLHNLGRRPYAEKNTD